MSDTKIFMKDLLNHSVKDLVSKRTELRKRLFTLRMQNQGWALKQTHLIKLVRRNIARVNTALSIKIKEQKWQ